MKSKSCIRITIYTALLMPTSLAHAGLLDARELALVMESTIVDLDTYMISIHNTHSNEQNTAGALSYTSTIDENGWQGNLLGSYNGVDINISYTGSLTFIGGPTSQYNISYSSDWLIDGESSSGSGTAIYTDPEFEFSIDLIDLEVSGSASISYGIATFTLEGTKDLDDEELDVSGAISLVDVPIIDVSLTSAELSFFLDQATGEYSSEITGTILNTFEIYNQTINEGDFTGDANSMIITSESTIISEPPALFLVYFGMLGFLNRSRIPLTTHKN